MRWSRPSRSFFRAAVLFRGAGACALIISSTSLAFADDAVAQAREFYDRGAAAYDAKDYATAGVELARADEIAPNDTVLDLALQSAVRAQNAPLVMELVTRVESRVPRTSALFTKARDARAKFESSVGRLIVHCPPPSTFCKASIDGKNQAIEVARFTTLGDHTVDLDADGASEKLTAHVSIGEITEIKPTPPAPKQIPPSAKPPASAGSASPSTSASITQPLPPLVAPPPPPSTEPRRHGLSPAWVWIGGGATLVAGGFLTGFAIDTQNKYNAFNANNANKTTATQSAGNSAEFRTNVLVCVTAGLGVATGVIGTFFVGWSSGPTVAINGHF